ncbi:hypothetical protein P8907_20755 [Bacillus atrophaeus]|uniref:hypothetical protein n=1 Tax=Bacillus atrophaeus TaxID=1452 RepID=UPI0022802A44|nr:hypothetical protein [Bacillus atrophaeus]MCY8810608.1 hypothetical protein [Bacillus atrophaeus]MCY8907760.1 hypothetical protein [Bacillus atrophaeus]MEC0837765.1 hypothetical protein [Bacillus atrophaeus]MEC0847666.1 hypothetical protein [Bacillus atrophaeus]MEC0849886.1 hypothetical protein [Bacillus atrophaeus]
MAKKKKDDIKINKKHGGKEFSNSFRFIGKVKRVQKKDEATDSWNEVPFFENTVTRTNKNRRVLQFIVETAYRNELKVELAGMEKDDAYLYSSKHGKSQKISWEDRKNKEKYPDDTYHLILPEWDLAEDLSKMLNDGMWVDVRGSYEFSTFQNNDGEDIKVVKRIVNQIFPLKNGEVEINHVKVGDEYRVYDSEVEGIRLGTGKAKEGTLKVMVGWLEPSGGELFITKVENGVEGKRFKVAYNEAVSQTDRIKIVNNVESTVRVNKADGKYEYVPYIRDFKSEDFKEINTFEMQIGIKSTYQDEETKDTKINAAFLSYGKEKSQVDDVELITYYKTPEEGKTCFADAFASLNRLDFLVVEGVDNNRAEFATIEVQETETEDNPFENVGEKVTSFEQVSTGTKKGLEVVNYIGGTYKTDLLTEEEISNESEPNQDPFAEVQVTDDDLPF